MNKKILFFSLLFSVAVISAHCQDTAQLLSQVTDIAKEGKNNGALGAFSPGVLFAGIIFGIIGFAAFSYGKKNAKYRPMVVGIVLMIYPYVIQNLIVLYLVGIVLTVLLFYPPER